MRIKNIEAIRKRRAIEKPDNDKLLLLTENKVGPLNDDMYKISYADFVQYIIQNIPTPTFQIQTVDIVNQMSITIVHNLGRFPFGTKVYNNLGNVVNCTETATNTTLTLEFNLPFTGKVLFI